MTAAVKVCYFRAGKPQRPNFQPVMQVQNSESNEGPSTKWAMHLFQSCPQRHGAPICSLPSRAVTHRWMAVSPASHSSWPIFKKPSFPRLPAEHSSSCLTHNVITAWEAVFSAGEGGSPREMQILHTWSKRTAIRNLDFVKHYAKLSNA